MKKGNMLLLVVMMAGIITIGQFKTSAGEIEDRVMERKSSGEQETGLGGNDVTGDFLDGNVPGTNHKYDITDDDIELQDMEEKVSSNAFYYQGLLYYCSRYQYECEIVYLQKYLEYIKLQVAASKDMYDMGEITAADVASYQAVQASVEAQLKVAENQSEYNNLFLIENNLDYSGYVIKEEKDVENTAYYLERYPEKNHMTMAGYVTNYNNALAYIEAKKIELDSLTMKRDLAKLLYETGELSKLELKQQETAVAKVQYELEQYYVELNLAYVNLMLYCK